MPRQRKFVSPVPSLWFAGLPTNTVVRTKCSEWSKSRSSDDGMGSNWLLAWNTSDIPEKLRSRLVLKSLTCFPKRSYDLKYNHITGKNLLPSHNSERALTNIVSVGLLRHGALNMCARAIVLVCTEKEAC